MTQEAKKKEELMREVYLAEKRHGELLAEFERSQRRKLKLVAALADTVFGSDGKLFLAANAAIDETPSTALPASFDYVHYGVPHDSDEKVGTFMRMLNLTSAVLDHYGKQNPNPPTSRTFDPSPLDDPLLSRFLTQTFSS